MEGREHEEQRKEMKLRGFELNKKTTYVVRAAIFRLFAFVCKQC